MKQVYYSSAKINSLDCEYNLIIGERSNGKSYAKKHDSLEDAYNDKTEQSKLIYLRRWDLELKANMVEQYFADAPVKSITHGEYDCIICISKRIYFARRDEDTNKVIKGRLAGYAMALTADEHYKSGSYIDVTNVIFEEFISNQTYLPKEPYRLQQFISTIARRGRIKVWLIGNTISRICPYYTEWELRNIPRQKQGTIDIYEHTTDQIDENGEQIVIKIAVEYAANSGNNGKMFFGKPAKMINNGAWQSEEKPHLPRRIETYEKLYEIIVEVVGFKFYCRFVTDKETGAHLWYIEPKTTRIKEDSRLITDRVLINPLATRGFIPLSPKEAIAFNYLKHGIIFYSDNLTGGDFEACIKQLLTK